MTPPAPPEIWHVLTRYWGWEPRDALAVWRALSRSRWTLPRMWRLTLLHFEARRPTSIEAALEFIQGQTSAERVLLVLEALVQEGQVGRSHAKTLEERVLGMTDARGAWK
jgi:hypothetical protein